MRLSSYKNLIVYAEIDRCMTDAIQAISGCTLGHRTLKYVDYGKFVATFLNLTSDKAVRVTIRESCDIKGNPQEIIETMANMPENDVVAIEEVTVNIAADDLLGFPKKRELCTVCGERIIDGHDMTVNDRHFVGLVLMVNIVD
ncbi:MAG: formylmethanofuran dehydrogenase subunit E family protein [Nitrososphaerota archaeon]|jgi:formylmethanofuran dehydrogenase subunit E|nr:formylmethanofuran dehydrogenase subunit E family protein [Nitrososphaerota archaeon]